MDSHRIAIIGGGNMGRALAGGLIRHGLPASALSIGEPAEAVRRALADDVGCVVCADNLAAAAGADVIVIAVKPQEAAGTLTRLAPALREHRALILSVVAGIRIRSLEAWCGADVPVVRAMPNRPSLVGAGATGLCASARASAADRELAQDIVRAVGTVVWVRTEEELDIVTALSGSGPAYFFLLAEAMSSAAVKLGLDAAAARTLAVATLYGAGVLAHGSDADLARLRAEVTSKGGTTEAALAVLGAAQGLPELAERALAAAAQRGRELAIRYGEESVR
ncbi:MAG TPA: pyrroline-5-carboxylate reductase [Steroidobacteraceae bacterium]|nr:pyrroline-5-carboxylate reductase [Steroidobacteraceae bacterium]